MAQTAIPCSVMRGGTSRGLVFRLDDLPADPRLRERVLVALMGSPHPRQVDGLGGADAVTSKAVMVARSARADADLDYHYAYVRLNQPRIDTSTSCGNMITAVGPFAIEAGLIDAGDPTTNLRIYDVNSDCVVTATIETRGGRTTYKGDYGISGVDGTGSPVRLDFASMVGGLTGALFPTGNRTDMIEGVPTTCIDMAMPMAFVDADAVGKTGHETKTELDADAVLIARLEAIRVGAAQRMGLGAGDAAPLIALVAPPAQGGWIASRAFVTGKLVPAYPVTGGVCLAVAASLAGTRPAAAARPAPGPVQIEHASGEMEVEVAVRDEGAVTIARAVLVRHARLLMRGEAYVPAAVWDGK